MQEILTYFESVPTFVRTLFLVSGVFFFLILEIFSPLFRFDYHKGKHAAINITFTLITLVINLFGAALIVATVTFSQNYQIGLLNMLDMSIVAYVIIGLVSLDLIGAWLVHFLEHKVKWMWRFHIIHHSDINVDVTSGLRHHPGENILRLAFTCFAVLVVGPTFGLVMLYQTISAFFAHLTHANIQMPKKIDQLLSYVFVTPYFHKVHHHYVQPYTDTNYGNIFSFWDHIFGTAVYENDMASLVYGLDTHFENEDHTSLKNLLLIPFQSYREPLNKK
jgi:sterol desaturase/sphingolipid hydroxylase (fatty acid hydroxylase superfamily)